MTLGVTLTINQATLSSGTADTSRIDGVPNQLVTLTSTVTGGSATTYTWRFWAYSGTQSVPSISGSSTATATFTPSGGASGFGQTFGIELVIDLGLGTQVSTRRILAIATQFKGLILPVFAESADPTASITNSGSAFIAASTDNAGGNYQGYHPRILAWEQQYENIAGIYNVIPNPNSVTGTVAIWIGSVYLPVCTINIIHAYLGCQTNTDTATLGLYTDGGGSLLTSLSTTSIPHDVTGGTNTTISSAGWYEFHMAASSSVATALCRGIQLNVKS